MALNEYAIVQTYRDFKLTEQHREKIYAGERIFPKRGGKTTYTIYNMSYAESDRNPVPAAKTPSSPDYNPSGSGETPSSGANGASYDKPSSANARPAL
jgi:hypothetical protein